MAIDEALKCKETGEEKTILFGLTGTGYFDMVAYEKFHNGQMTDYIPSDEELAASFAQLPRSPARTERPFRCLKTLAYPVKAPAPLYGAGLFCVFQLVFLIHFPRVWHSSAKSMGLDT